MAYEDLVEAKRECLKKILYLSKKANSGHIGASLSCLDILIYLHMKFMNEGDKFLLSKGHAALSLYVVLARARYFPEELLETYYQNGTLLAAHPPCNRKLNGVLFGTGSLGHGLPLAGGFAYSSRFTKKKNRVFCLLSDGDCDEGSTWEAALFASQHKLSNLYVVVDNNALQGFGKTKEVLDLEPLTEKWKSFNFDVVVADPGNDFASLDSCFQSLAHEGSDRPKCIIAKTTKGSGVSFMENKLEWHYLPMKDDQYAEALKEIERM